MHFPSLMTRSGATDGRRSTSGGAAGVLRSPRSVQPTHPGVRSGVQLTRGERAADRVRSTMGSWGYVFGAVVFLLGWTLGNRRHGFDPYPFSMLNVILACLASMQGAILLIVAKREAQISAELALHDHETNLQAAAMIEAVHALTHEMHRTLCPEPAPDVCEPAIRE